VAVNDAIAYDDIAIVANAQGVLVLVRAVGHAVGGQPCRNRLHVGASPAHGVGFVDHHRADRLSGNKGFTDDDAAVGIHCGGNGCDRLALATPPPAGPRW
jgi:hypothetical protein